MLNDPRSLENFFPYVGREIGMIAKTFKKSNQLTVDKIDNRNNFKIHIGNLINYCLGMFDCVKTNGLLVLEEIVRNNEKRTDQASI